MVKFQIMIEGGGSTRAEQMPLRRGFRALLDKLGESGRRAAPLCGGGRAQTFNEFKIAVKGNPTGIVLLLVDSEGPVEPNASPWAHVARRQGDGWQQPKGVTDAQLHFMVETMETWLVADPDALATYYGWVWLFYPAKILGDFRKSRRTQQHQGGHSMVHLREMAAHWHVAEQGPQLWAWLSG